MTGFTRRTVGGLALAGLAGCTGLGDSGGSGAVFEDVYVEGVSLVVGFDGSAEVDSVTVVSPDGSEFASRSVGAGVSNVSVKIGTRYSAGEHTVVAAREGESVGETTIDIRPDVEILEVGVGANNLDRMPDELGNTEPVEGLVRLKNTGNGPQEIEKLLLLGDLPNPTTALKQSDNEEASGILHEASGAGEVESITIEGKSERLIFTRSLPFTFEGDGVDCSSKEQTGTFRVVGVTSVGTSDFSAEYSISYSASDSYNDCDITISEAK